MVKIGTYSTHPAAFLDQPFAAPHQSFLPIGSEVPIDKKSSFPPGEAKRGSRGSCIHSTDGSVAEASGRLLVDPYRAWCKTETGTIQRATPPLRLAKSRLRRLLACIAPAGVSVSPFGLPAFNSGMIATGNHNFERFAALCNTPGVEPRALRAIVLLLPPDILWR